MLALFLTGENRAVSGIDPECHPQPSAYDDKRVCAKCFEDDDLVALIEDYGLPEGCDFCGECDAPTAPFDEIAQHIHERLREFYGKAVDQLPYESAEGGYQAWHVDSYDLLREEIELELPRDDGQLFEALLDEIGDDIWCQYDWLSLDPDESMKSSWDDFCQIVKHDRRFFFHNVGTSEIHHPDERSPAQFFQDLGRHVDNQNLVVTIPAGTKYFRARPRANDEEHTTAAALGPPPHDKATQSNRMNPPGIPMFYGADNSSLATIETRGNRVSIGIFETKRAIRILDLAHLPPVPGFFSISDRDKIFTLSFLQQFAEIIIQPVERNDRTQIDYIPTQVFTEFLRDYSFEGGPIDGIQYRSATGEPGCNVVLFATPANVEGANSATEPWLQEEEWLRLIEVKHE